MAFLMRSFYAQIKNVHKNKWTKLCLLISFFKGLTVEVAVSWRIINASTVQCHFKLNWTFSRKITKKRGQISLIQTFLTNTADWIILKWMLPLQITERPLSLLLFFCIHLGTVPGETALENVLLWLTSPSPSLSVPSTMFSKWAENEWEERRKGKRGCELERERWKEERY